MVVAEEVRADVMRMAMAWTEKATMPAVSTPGSVALAMYRQAENGEAWPVSGDATARLERHKHRRVRDRMLRPLGTRVVIEDGKLRGTE